MDFKVVHFNTSCVILRHDIDRDNNNYTLTCKLSTNIQHETKTMSQTKDQTGNISITLVITSTTYGISEQPQNYIASPKRLWSGCLAVIRDTQRYEYQITQSAINTCSEHRTSKYVIAWTTCESGMYLQGNLNDPQLDNSLVKYLQS